MNPEYIEQLSNSWWPYIISFFIVVISVIRNYMGGPQCPSKTRMDGKTVLITGASGGIGFETAKELAARGATVILTCRNFENGQKATAKIKRYCRQAKIDVKLLDVSDMSAIRRFSVLMKQNYKKIDVLINNAGIVFHPFKWTSEGFELTLATNYLGPFLLTHMLLPLLKKSDNGRIINLTSVAHSSGRINLNDMNLEKRFLERDAFSQSKLALILFTRHVAKILKDTRVTINCVNPGIVRNTKHLKNSPFGAGFMAKVSTYPWVWLFLKTPKQGAQTVIFAATDPILMNVTGEYLSDCEIREPGYTAQNAYIAEQLYDKTCSMLQMEKKLISELGSQMY
ncbi:retinol dehydrogenase 12-like [Onthophagus taurus]|uniref:retinol dehydrogenase 12-like n=1 Tax=Onthophagus taurus TaxID=166361 RepID=UPI0039BDE963